MNNNMQIGTANISYNEQGEIVSAIFTPSLELDVNEDEDLLKQLKSIPCTSNEEIIRENAALVLGGWWNQLNQIELADRDKWKMDSEIVACNKWPSGRVQMCSIKFTFRRLESKLVSMFAK